MQLDSDSKTFTVGLLTDAGLAEKLTSRVREWLCEQPIGLDGFTAEAEVLSTPLTLNADGAVPLIDIARRIREQRHWDLVICFTNLPRHPHGNPVVLDIGLDDRAALISLPALGLLRTESQTKEVVLWAIRRMLDLPTMRVTPLRTKLLDPGHDAIDLSAGYTGLVGKTTLLAGMVRDNRPWRLVPSLSTSLAAALAGGAFGVFYSNIWQLGSTMSIARLCLTTAAAVFVYASWLIVNHGMWERRTSRRPSLMQTVYNASTVTTLLAGTLIMYALLFVLILLGSLTVISPEFLSQQTGKPTNLGTYAVLSWLASSLGMFAGAVGSSVESADDVRAAAYSKRVAQRRAQQEAQELRPTG